MEEAPPVPPKDAAYSTRMELDRPPTAPSSGSKRKRSVHEESYHSEHSELENVDPDAHTPKRNRASVHRSDASASEDATPAQHKSIRRKKGTRNLSNLNLRHAAAKQALSRESKFQEGSLTDKPSEKPPSVFTKMPRSESDNSLRVDEMMEDYHDDAPVPRYTIKQNRTHSRATVTMEPYKKDDGKGFFQFGRQLAANFNPTSLWQRWWGESKDEPMEDSHEAAEKARQKAEVEAKYAEMKKAGQFNFQTIRKRASNVPSASEVMETPRDSGIEIDGLHDSRKPSAESGLVPPPEDSISYYSGSEVPNTASKQHKGLKSRLHFKKPSLSNIKDDLKRVKSDFNLGATVRQRESSSSLSPVKQDFEDSALRKSQSRYDIKKQHKLTKRVSDLEVKLEQAKKELDEALVDASPLPNLTNKYPTFRASGTFRKSKFIPGKLPSLPSERILMAEQMREIRGDAETASENEAASPRKAMDLNEIDDEMNEEDTVKASRARPYPTRASTLFNLDNNNIQEISSNEQSSEEQQSSALTKPSSKTTEIMDPNSVINNTNGNATKPVETEGYSSLDAKLKALESNVKIANKAKQTKSKKRKSNAADDKIFKPGTESNDDSDYEEKWTPKKKRKSGGAENKSSPKNAAAKKSSPKAKKGKGGPVKANGTTSSPARRATSTQAIVQQPEEEEAAAGADEFSPDELAGSGNEGVRTSLDEDRTLDVVYEEEEETSAVPLNDEPPKPTARATPARYGRPGLRSRSNSPHKRAPSVQPGVEEQMMTRAAAAVKKHPGRASRSVSPPPKNGYTKTTTIEETVTVKPREGDVPKLPRGANGSFESLDDLGADKGESEVEVLSGKDRKSSFEWPEDVF